GAITAARAKHKLPNYGVFDEKRVFDAGPIPGPMPFRGRRLGVMTCEDMWSPDVAEALAETGAQMLIALNGSPFDERKADQRLQVGLARVAETELPLIYTNQIGGQDELVFDGGSFALNPSGDLAGMAPFFDPATPVWRLADGTDGWRVDAAEKPGDLDRMTLIYRAMALGLRDYVDKNGFPGVVLGLSGGIDSALTAAVAVDALGPDRVRCLLMPSIYTSRESVEDAEACARHLGVRLDVASIDPMVETVGRSLAPALGGAPDGVTAENIQSRLRGLTLMTVSNATGAMVLTTGNKSEMSVGYATLYGDMCGGYSVLKDVYKTDVFALSHWRNAHRPPDGRGPDGMAIPTRIIEKPPSAELRPDQKDEDSLPPYDRLDGMLRGLIERDEDVGDLVAQGFDVAEAKKIRRLLHLAEYKRRQAPPGVKITPRTLSRDRRYPITNAFYG
ncbi:MAG: NAD+ synthase, partial [Pseudomonadota bacterium]